jgi:hypothetical protein
MHHSLKDITGMRFGKLVVLSRATNYENGMSRWNCLCDCGGLAIVGSHRLRSSKTANCGCCKRTTKTHGHANRPIIHGTRAKGKTSKTYNSWRAMRSRCLNPKTAHWVDYGGRGIKICGRWNSFILFIEDMGERPVGTSLERINNNGNYEPSNCRWATQSEQVKNQRRGKLIGKFSDEEIIQEFNRRFIGAENGKQETPPV